MGMRDVPATASYFWCMEVARRYIPGYHDSAVVLPFVAGCSAGVGCWLFAMPGDCLKSIIQTQFAVDATASGSLSVNYQQLFAGNFFGLYRGFGWVFSRAVVTSGVGVIGL